MERKLSHFFDRSLSRRSFVAGTGGAIVGSLAVGCSGGDTLPLPQTPTTTTTTPPAGGLTDADYLNFALNLEYLEAEFYLRAATGTGLGVGDTGNLTSNTTGGSAIPKLTPVQSAYIYEVAQNELDHVRLLRNALGSAAVSAPKIDLTASFNALATAAGLGSSFDPFSSYDNYLIGAFIFEDVGVTAYHGAAGALTSKANLAVGVRIHAVEAYHAASIRSQIVAAGPALVTIANQVSTVRSSLGGGKETALSASTIVAADPITAQGFARTPDEVLHIVYGTPGGAGVKSGTFFPSGLNGNISATTA